MPWKFFWLMYFNARYFFFNLTESIGFFEAESFDIIATKPGTKSSYIL